MKSRLMFSPLEIVVKRKYASYLFSDKSEDHFRVQSFPAQHVNADVWVCSSTVVD